jgi:hypothetical protein
LLVLFACKAQKELIILTGETELIKEIRKHDCICYYPSSGTDLSNIDFFGSGKKLWEERTGGESTEAGVSAPVVDDDPDLFIHTDVNFYQEFASGLDIDGKDQGIHGSFEVVEYKELPALYEPNLIYENYDHAGKCFVYRLKVWGCQKIRTLIFCLCENEYFVAKILIANNLKVDFIWSRNWNGGQTYGTWLTNVLDKLQTKKVYTDWLCVPGKKGEPRNRKVEEKYPELMLAPKVRLVRNDDIHWIDQGGHGWVEEFDVMPID